MKATHLSWWDRLFIASAPVSVTLTTPDERELRRQEREHVRRLIRIVEEEERLLSPPDENRDVGDAD